MSKLQPVRGTHDILPEEFAKFRQVVTLARELGTLYGFEEMSTPIFEPTEVFARSLGDTSDIVHKEMFTFDTKGGESVTLRPEFTAGIVRAFISNGMQQHLPLKLFSTGPLFRYERPQKGRQRQFHQVNFEWLGDGSAEADVEIILLACHFLHYFEHGKDIRLHINTLGDKESRARYREALVAYLTPHAGKLSEDSQRRLSANPLRVLDSKDEGDRAIIKNAPSIHDYLSPASRERFDKIKATLDRKGSGINAVPFLPEMGYTIDHTLVRGLDYYTDTVFEFVSHSPELGSQSTVLAGGRYDGLVEMMGGKAVPAIGFAAGVERLCLMLNTPPSPQAPIFILPEGAEEAFTLRLASVIRAQVHQLLDAAGRKSITPVEILWNGALGKRLGKAAERGAERVIILGKAEVERDFLVVRDMKTRQQQEVPILDFINGATLNTHLKVL